MVDKRCQVPEGCVDSCCEDLGHLGAGEQCVFVSPVQICRIFGLNI